MLTLSIFFTTFPYKFNNFRKGNIFDLIDTTFEI